MGLSDFLRRESRAEAKADVEQRAQETLADSADAVTIGELINGEALSESVTMKEAMSSPGVWAAINFLSAAMASMPIEVFQRTEEEGGDLRVKDEIANMLAQAPNDETTSHDWREMFFAEVFGPGRGYTYIERDKNGWPINLFMMEYSRTTVRRVAGRTQYIYDQGNGRTITYAGRDVIDLAYLRKSNFVESYNPVMTCAAAIRQGLNANRYALTVFGKNGIPPYLLKGPFSSAKAALAAAADLIKVTRRSAEEGKPILPVPGGHDLTRLGDDPEKMQLTPVQVFAVQQAARIYQLPPVFLQELSKGNYNNIEHQDLHLVKHTLRRWVEKFEQQLTLKLFGRNSRYYVKINLDGLMRGDFKTRIEAIVRAVQNSLLTPNEGRELLDKAPKEGGDKLLVQGATVPLSMAGKVFNKTPAANDPEPPVDEGEPTTE